MTFRSIAVEGWGGSTTDGGWLAGGDEFFAPPELGVGSAAVVAPGPAVGLGALLGPGAAVGFGVGLGPGADVGLASGGDSPPTETGVAAPRFVAGAMAAM
ncbi:MAG TPA: hypothetical protein VGC34_12655 [Steroidobacteraceae bacterium]